MQRKQQYPVPHPTPLQARSEENKAKRLKETLHFIGCTGPTVAPAAVAIKPAASGLIGFNSGKSSKNGGGSASAAAALPAAAAPKAGPRPRHVVFVESAAEARAFDAAAYFGTPAELLDRTFNRPRSEQLASAGAVLGMASKQAEK